MDDQCTYKFEQISFNLITISPTQAAQEAMRMTEDTVQKATDWGYNTAWALMGTVLFFSLLAFFFRKL